MRLSVIIPAYNEATRLPRFLDKMLPWLQTHYAGRHEIIVVDDGSTDGTADIASRLLGDSHVIRLPQNRGKGAAVRTGMLAAKGQLRLFADADGATPIAELQRLLPAIEAGADIAIGSRAGYGGSRRWARASTEVTLPSREQPEWNVRWHRHLTGRIFSRLVRWMTGLPYRDTQCGFKLFRAEAVERVFPLAVVERFAFDVEILYLATKLELRISEIAVHWHEIDGSKVRLFQDAWQMLREVVRIRRRNPVEAIKAKRTA